MFTWAGCLSFEWLDVPTPSALKGLVLVSWVAQDDRMLLGFRSLLYLPLALCIKKYGVVYLSVFLNHLALIWESLSLQDAAPSCGIESGVHLEILVPL